MLRKLVILRKDIAERQRLAGVSLAETVNALLDRIEDYTQRLLAIDERIEEIKARSFS